MDVFPFLGKCLKPKKNRHSDVPLLKTLGYHQTFKMSKATSGKNGDCNVQDIRQSLLHKTSRITVDDKKQDPLLDFGIGIISYRTMLRQLIALFFAISILVIPCFLCYHDNLELKVHNSWLSQWSLGNMGFMKTHCEFSPLVLNKIFLRCPYGQIEKIFPAGHGINSYDQKIRDACLVDPQFGNDMCDEVIDHDFLTKEFSQKCIGAQDCEIKLKEPNNSFRTDIFPSALEILGNSSHSKSKCLDSRSQLFIQFACGESYGQSQHKYQKLSVMACLFSFIAVLYMLCLIYAQVYSKIEDKIYDIETVTADDFTVQLMLNEDQIAFFKLAYKDKIKERNGSVALALKHYLIEELSQKMEDQGRVRMRHELESNIIKMKKVYERFKIKEYDQLGKHLDKYRDEFKVEKSVQDFSVADI